MNKVQIMGIFNATPDSFYDGYGGDGKLNSFNIEKKISEIIDADIIDVGGESTRPGSKKIKFNTEIKRIEALNEVVKSNSNIFSIDTYKYEVAKYALENGYGMINDIYAGRYDSRIFELASDYKVPIVLMHMRGNPENMQVDVVKYSSIVDNIVSFFEERIKEALDYGICPENIILDPGIGFGKSVEDNFIIIKHLKDFKKLGYKILLGLSRKSFLTFNGNKPKERLAPTLSMSTIAILNGVDILRVHDVSDTINAVSAINNYIKIEK